MKYIKFSGDSSLPLGMTGLIRVTGGSIVDSLVRIDYASPNLKE